MEISETGNTEAQSRKLLPGAADDSLTLGAWGGLGGSGAYCRAPSPDICFEILELRSSRSECYLEVSYETGNLNCNGECHYQLLFCEIIVIIFADPNSDSVFVDSVCLNN